MSDDPNAELEARGFVKGSPLLKMLGGEAPIPIRIIDDFAGSGGRFKGKVLALRCTTAEEQEDAASRAIKHLTGAPPAGRGFNREDLFCELAEAFFAFECRVQVLALALVAPDNPRVPMARDANELRRMLEPDEIVALHEQYLDFVDERSPLRKLKQEEVESFIDDLGKGLVSRTAMSHYDSTSLRSMLTSTALELQRLTRRVSQLTSPSSDTGEDGSNPSSTDETEEPTPVP